MQSEARYPIFSSDQARVLQYTYVVAWTVCRGQLVAAPMRKKKGRINISKETRRRARAGIGMPPAERLIPDKRLKPPKHKKPLLDPRTA